MNILKDLKDLLIANNLSTQDNTFYNYDCSDINSVILKLDKGSKSDLAIKYKVSISVKNSSMQSASQLIESIFSALCPDIFNQKVIWVNDKLFMFQPESPPQFLEKQKNGMYIYQFSTYVINER